MRAQSTLVVYPSTGVTPKTKATATIKRANRKMCIAVAKAHYAGPNHDWYWIEAGNRWVRAILPAK